MLLLLVGYGVRFTPFVGQQKLFILNHLTGSVDRPFEVVPVFDGIGRTGIDAIPAQNATAVIDLVDLRITMVYRVSLFIRAWVFCSLDVDCICRTGCCAKKT